MDPADAFAQGRGAAEVPPNHVVRVGPEHPLAGDLRGLRPAAMKSIFLAVHRDRVVQLREILEPVERKHHVRIAVGMRLSALLEPAGAVAVDAPGPVGVPHRSDVTREPVPVTLRRPLPVPRVHHDLDFRKRDSLSRGNAERRKVADLDGGLQIADLLVPDVGIAHDEAERVPAPLIEHAAPLHAHVAGVAVGAARMSPQRQHVPRLIVHHHEVAVAAAQPQAGEQRKAAHAGHRRGAGIGQSQTPDAAVRIGPQADADPGAQRCGHVVAVSNSSPHG